MEPQSPPKRMTRARAAAKASASETTTASSRAKLATASSKAKTAAAATASSSSRPASSTAAPATASAAAKRKLRVEDIETDNEQDELGLDRPQPPTMQKIARAVRGRPKKTAADPADEPQAAPDAAPPARSARGRPPTKIVPASEPLKEPTVRPSSRASAAATAAPRATRTRKTASAQHASAAGDAAEGAAEDAAEEPAKKRTTRARATSATLASATAATTTNISVRSASATIAAKSAAPKKRVTFEEPEKENIAPTAGTAKAKAAQAAPAKSPAETTSTGLKAKPVRRAADAAAASATAPTKAATTAAAARPRAAAGKAGRAAAADKSSKPLSPKKVTQVRLAREFDVDSEDELGASDESHLKPFERSPTKPSLAAGVTAAERTKALLGAGLDLEASTRDITANAAVLPAPEFPGAMLTSPARRPAQSPVKEGLAASPARRLDGLVPLDSVLASTAKPSDGGDANKSNSNASVLFSPAKRFPVHPMSLTAGGHGDNTLRSPTRTSLLQTPAKRPKSPVKAAILLQRPDMKPCSLSTEAGEPASTRVTGMSNVEEVDEADDEDVSDDDVSDDDADSDERTQSLTQMLNEMASEAAMATMPLSPSRRRFPGRPSTGHPHNTDPTPFDSEEATSELTLPPGEPMDVDDSIMDAAAVLVTMSPPKAPSGVFGLREKDLILDDDNDAESDNETTLSRIPLFRSGGSGLSTPRPARDLARGSKTPSTRSNRATIDGQSPGQLAESAKFGFTPLADQLNGWRAHSPSKAEVVPTPTNQHKDGGSDAEPDLIYTEVAEDGPVLSLPVASERSGDPSGAISFFDDAMAGHSLPSSPGQNGISSAARPADQSGDNDCVGLKDNVFLDEAIPMPEFDEDVDVTQEDLELAQEANDMSLMEATEIDDMINLPPSTDDSMSEASQEYGDENATPIDPALLVQGSASPSVPPSTPQRVLTRTFHTVSKVPLKASDESTPQPTARRRRSLSTSRLPTSSRRRSSIGFGSASSNGSSDKDNTKQYSRDSSSPDKKAGGNSCGLTRSATVISYSPTKKQGRRSSSRRRSRRESFGGGLALPMEPPASESEDEQRAAPSVPVTPTKPDMAWSTAGTPARTPRRDLEPTLLHGAVVFVDVHTTEGADASAIFVELLSQMGARCVKSWSWNPSSPPSNQDGSSRVGITHVVFKDGSKRTLEKVRESNGIVQCVGVSWVLDCERENQWLDEAPYCIDTAQVPRGGARRRKSMEPQALANMNGLLVSTPAKQTVSASSSGRECRTAPSTPMNRRDSALWVRTPDEEGSSGKRKSRGRRSDAGSGDAGKSDNEENGADGGDSDDDGYDCGEADWGMLTPVPKTPAPEAIARYAANIMPSTPYGSDADSDGGGYRYGEDDTLDGGQFDETPLVTRTCPPKQQRAVSYHELGAGILSREKDEGVLMRLMAARRKSLQFAPKIASPLSKAWN